MESLKTLQPEPSLLYLQVVNVTFKIRKSGHLSAVVFVKVSYESMYASALVMVRSHSIHIHIYRSMHKLQWERTVPSLECE